MKAERDAHDDLTLTLTREEAEEMIKDLYTAASLAEFSPLPMPIHARDYRKYAQTLRDGLGGTP